MPVAAGATAGGSVTVMRALPCQEQRQVRCCGRCRGEGRRSIPFERSLLPLIDKADRENRKEYHHRPEAERAQLLEGDGPRKKKGHFEVEDDEQDGDQVE